MPITVLVGDEEVEFPDGMSDSQIESVLQREQGFGAVNQALGLADTAQRYTGLAAQANDQFGPSAIEPYVDQGPPAPVDILGESSRNLPDLQATTRGGPPLSLPEGALRSTLGEIGQGIGETLTHPSPIPTPFEIKKDENPYVAAGKEAVNLLVGVPQFFTSALGIEAAGAGVVAPSAVAGLFTADLLYSLGKQIKSTYQNWSGMSPAEKVTAVEDMVATGAFAGLTGKATAKGAQALAEGYLSRGVGEPIEPQGGQNAPSIGFEQQVGVGERAPIDEGILPTTPSSRNRSVESGPVEPQVQVEAKAPEITPAQLAAIEAPGGMESLPYSDADLARYKELRAEQEQLKKDSKIISPETGQFTPEATKNFKEFEELRNKYNGMPPEQIPIPRVVEDYTEEPGQVVATAEELKAAEPERKPVPDEPTPTTDWDKLYEDLADSLDAFSPARHTGVRSYELDDMAQRFVDYAKADKSGKPLIELAKDFAKQDEATPAQIKKLRAVLKDMPGVEPVPTPEPPAPKPVAPKQGEGVAPKRGLERPVPLSAEDKADQRYDEPGITRPSKPNLIVVQLRDLQSRPIREVTIKPTRDEIADAAAVVKKIRSEAAGDNRVSIRESAGTLMDERGMGVTRYASSPNGPTWASVETLVKARAESKMVREGRRPAKPEKQIAPPTPPAATPAKATAKAQGEVKPITPGMSVNQKEQILGDLVRDKIINAPSFQKLVAASKAFRKSLHGQVSEAWLTEKMQTPWDFLSEHAGVMNAKSARARTLQSLADAVIREAELPMMAPGRYRGMDYRIDWDKLAAERPQASPPKPPETPGGEGEVGPGMGGAIPSEFERSPETATSIKNKTVDRERAERGLPPAIQPARKSFGEVWDQAMAVIDRDPDYQKRLIDELRDKPRALTDLEDAVLLQRQIDLQNEYGKATRDLAQAYDDGRTEAVDTEKLRVAGLSDQLLDLYNIGKKVGTETGRGLAARKMMAYEDFSLAKMELEKRAANEGRPLTDQQRGEIVRLNKRIEETQKAFDDYVARIQARDAERAIKEALAEVERKAKEQPAVEPHVRIIADKIKGYFDNRAEAALKRLSGKLFTLSPQVLADLTDLGVSRILSGAAEFTSWSAKMVEALGERVKPHLQTIWESSQSALNEHIEKVAGKRAKPVKRAVKGAPVAERIEANKAAIAEKVNSGKRNEITFLVQKLARAFVEQGIKERDALIDAVHGFLQEIDPDFTRRDAMDAISGYGDFRQLTKDQISKELRDLKGQMQQVAKLEDMQAGRPPLKTGLERRIPSAEESRLIKLVNDAKNKFQIPVEDPNTQLKSSLDTLKTRLANRTVELREKLAAGDFSKRPRREIILDAEASRLRAENFRARQEYQRGLIQDRLKNRPWWVKAQDTFLRWFRGGILSSPVVFAKLTAAAVVRAGLTPLEEAVGAGISKAVPRLAARAPREGFLNSKAEAKAILSQLTKGPKDAWSVLRTGEADLDVLYGKGREGAIGESQVRPFSLSDIPGRAHAALKSSTKRAEFERSLEKRLTYEIRNGVDVSSPAVQLRVAVEAYKDANRSIFLQDNRVVSAYNRALRALEEPSKVTGKPELGAKTVATVARTLVPIVRVPSNIVAEAFQFATGSVTGSARFANAVRKGIDTLPPEQADLIMRELKKGSIGAAAIMTGFLLPNVWGGYYQKGEKRKKSDIKASAARIAGLDVPPSLIHHPIFETIQAGSTVRRIADANVKKTSSEKRGLPAGVMAASLGLIEETPFVREMVDTAKAFNPSEQNAYFGELAKSITEPQLIQWIAKQKDLDAQGEVTPRQAKTFAEHLKLGIPGLRQTVPKKKQ